MKYFMGYWVLWPVRAVCDKMCRTCYYLKLYRLYGWFEDRVSHVRDRQLVFAVKLHDVC